MDQPVLEVCDLSVSVGERPVLKGVSLALLPGEVKRSEFLQLLALDAVLAATPAGAL